MDVLNDQIRYKENPIYADLSDSDLSETLEYTSKLRTINAGKRKKRGYSFDDWCLVYADDLWYLWGIISEYRSTGVLNCLDFAGFCDMCYQNSTKF